MEKLFEYDEHCENCRKNPAGKKPFVRMMRFKTTDLTDTVAFKLAEESKVEPDCVLCHTIRAFAILPKEQQLKLLKENQHGDHKN
jgi:hypothetical protein